MKGLDDSTSDQRGRCNTYCCGVGRNIRIDADPRSNCTCLNTLCRGHVGAMISGDAVARDELNDLSPLTLSLSSVSPLPPPM